MEFVKSLFIQKVTQDVWLNVIIVRRQLLRNDLTLMVIIKEKSNWFREIKRIETAINSKKFFK